MNEKISVQRVAMVLCAISFATNYAEAGRQYAPIAKRFMQSDPLSLLPIAGGGSQDGLNKFVYVRHNPVGNLDPTGMLAYYGNWCGPNWSGGCTGWGCQSPPIDELDLACKDHDICYRTNKCSYEWLWPGQAQMACDIELCQSLKDLRRGICQTANLPTSTVIMCNRADQIWVAFYCSWYPI